MSIKGGEIKKIVFLRKNYTRNIILGEVHVFPHFYKVTEKPVTLIKWQEVHIRAPHR